MTQAISPSAARRLVARVDPYMILIILTVVLASMFPTVAAWRGVLDAVIYGAVMLLFLLYGARLAPSAIWAGLSNWRLQALVFAGTFLLFPLLGLGVTQLIRGLLPNELIYGFLFLCILPSTVQSSITFTSIANGNVPAALCCASLSNLVGVLLTPLLAGLLFSTHGAGISAHAVEQLAIQIFLPFCVGQILRPFVGRWLVTHRTVTLVVDRGAILLVIYGAFSAGVVAGIWTQVSVGSLILICALDLSLLLLALWTMRSLSRIMRFPVEDEITILFCGSKKSMASGVPIATAIFSAKMVGLIVLPLMLFHQIQLMVCAVLARRYAERDKATEALQPVRA
ncbi:MAG: bile acid:sodium symporter family protein [Sphingobium sp.]